MIMNHIGGGGVELIGTEQDFRKGLESITMDGKLYTLSKDNLCSKEHISIPAGLVSYPDMPSSITATQWASHIEKVSDGIYVIAAFYNSNSYSARVVRENGTTWELGTWTFIESMGGNGPQPGPFRVADKEFIISGFESPNVYWYQVNDDLSITLLGTFTMPVTPTSQYFKFYTLAVDSSNRVTKVVCAGLAYQGILDHSSKTITFSSGTNISNKLGFAVWGVEGTKHHFICLYESGSATCSFIKYTFDCSSGIITNQGSINFSWHNAETGGDTDYGSEPLPFAFRVNNQILLVISGILGTSLYYNKYLVFPCDGTESGLIALNPTTKYTGWTTYSSGSQPQLITGYIDPIGESGDGEFALSPRGPVISLSGSSLVVTQLSNNLSSLYSYNADYGMSTTEQNPKAIWYNSNLVKVQLSGGEVTTLVGYSEGEEYIQVNPYINEPISGFEKYSKLCGVVTDITDTVRVLVPTNM